MRKMRACPETYKYGFAHFPSILILDPKKTCLAKHIVSKCLYVYFPRHNIYIYIYILLLFFCQFFIFSGA
jgi:hypothetical protein